MSGLTTWMLMGKCRHLSNVIGMVESGWFIIIATSTISPRDTPPALMVNWCELTIARDTDGVIIYHNAFITRHPIGASNVAAVVTAGRARWKVENENNNVLKTKGYHLEHNFGHGKQHLSALLLTLNLLAFCFTLSCNCWTKLSAHSPTTWHP
jgi:hypothetical protein